MSKTAISVENLSKVYQLGQIGTGTISRDIERWWTTKIRGKEDPFLRIGETNNPSSRGKSDIVWSLKDINIDIQKGETVGIIGKNGAGKSTLLKLLSRVTAPTNGSIKVKGRIASLLEVGTGFHPELTGRENIYLNGAILGMRKKEITHKLDEIVDFSGVERYIDTPVKRYSSGMYVRLAFAVAANLQSEILIVDEVLAVGDAEFQKKCLGKMGDVSKEEGRTILFVSHNMAAVSALCNRAIVLINGEKKYDGSQISGINYYLSNQNVSNIKKPERSWNYEDAPGDERAKILKIEVKALDGDVINFSSGLCINFTIVSNVINCHLDVSFNVISQDYGILFHHGKHLENSTDLKKGKYDVQVFVPANILNEGVYHLDVWLGLGSMEVVGKKLYEIVKFEVLSSKIDHIIKKLPGAIRPNLEYKIEYKGTKY